MPETKPLLLITINGGPVAEWMLLVFALGWVVYAGLEVYRTYLNWLLRKMKGGGNG